MPTTPASIHARVLQDVWSRLPESLRWLHSTLAPEVIRGRFDVKRGTNLLSHLCARLMNLPQQAAGYDLVLTIEPRPESELWLRRFNSKTLTTLQRPGPAGCIREQFGLLEFIFELQAEGRTLKHIQRAVALKVFDLRLPLPSSLAPRVCGSEHASADDAEVHVQVEVRLPLIGLLLAYDGTVRFLPHPVLQ